MDLRMAPIVDYLVAQVPVPPDVVRDTTRARPVRYVAYRLYGWSLSQRGHSDGDSTEDKADFQVRLAVVLPGEAEVIGQQRLESVSDALDAAARAIADWPRTHRQVDPLWDELAWVSIDYDAVIQTDIRAAWVDLAGYRFVS